MKSPKADVAASQRREVDALVVINQFVTTAQVGELCVARGYRSVLVVSSHRLFEEEITELRSAAPTCEIEVRTFGDWLSDRELQECDDRASADFANELHLPTVRVPYATLFSARTVYYKNAALRQRIAETFDCANTHYVSGLGIADRFWRQHAERFAPTTGGTAARQVSPLLLAVRLYVAFLRRRTHLRVIDAGDATYYFTSIKRLSVREESRIRDLSLGFWRKVFASFEARTLSPARILQVIVSDGILATTIHGYPSVFADDRGLFQIFLDGFHPSNYPRTYVDLYGPSTFVSSDPLSVNWFVRHGKKVLAAPEFIQVRGMSPPASVSSARRILLALNHAGDWSSLISRSDTDSLVDAFCKAAARYPEMEFILRLHPTMASDEHEGPHSKDRLTRHVAATGLANLWVSDRSLEEDIDGCDAVVSEYSQVLIDAMRAGKLGLIANFTGRRSFMVDYEKLGFAAVDTEADFGEWLRCLRDDFASLARRQADAADRYNVALERWMGGAWSEGFD